VLPDLIYLAFHLI